MCSGRRTRTVVSALRDCIALCVLVASAQAAIQVQLTPSLAEPQPVGTRITWTATAADSNPGTLDYRFSITAPGEALRIMRDFDTGNTFEWAPGEREGIYAVRVVVRNQSTKAISILDRNFMVSSRVTGGTPAVSHTNNPLVALYSAPSCPAGARMRVRFNAVGEALSQSTSFKACEPPYSMNFYIAGMRGNTQYELKHDIVNGPIIQTGPSLRFTTGTPVGNFPQRRVVNPADPPSSLGQPVLLHSYTGSQRRNRITAATDLQGRIIWYYDQAGSSIGRPVPGGTILLIDSSISPNRVLREIDLAGNIVRETNALRVSEQLQAMGQDPIRGIHHEATRLPGGRTAVLGYVERLLTNVQGPGTVDVVGDMIIVLDWNFQVIWAWNSFEHLDVTRKAVLNESCASDGPGCSTLLLRPRANDWTHSNSIDYSPVDGNLLLSVRHQDWILKIDYKNGLGSGRILWRLGKDGDFSINSSDPYPWFSHQHDPEYELSGLQVISLYDNGNTRQGLLGNNQNSRGQVYRIDEASRTVSLILNADLGNYSFAVGSAQRLANGNYHFDSGALTLGGNAASQALEIRPNGQIVFNLQSSTGAYRSFRMKSLYAP